MHKAAEERAQSAHAATSLQVNQIPRPTPGPKELLVKVSAASLNHRDLFVRQHLYPAISFEHTLLADAYGTVVEAGPGASQDLLNKPVLMNPSRGWESDPLGPEDTKKFTVCGGSALTTAGAAQEYLVVPEDEVVEAPAHLSPAEGAALPLVGVTGWRAFATKSGNAVAGRNILVTGIGGGVALTVLQFAVAKGCNVYVTSSDPAKLEKARELGARGGVSYKDKDWHAQLAAQLPRDRPYVDAIIDGAGGDVVARGVKLLKAGGVVVVYGMTVAPKMDWTMQAVLKNIEVRGTTMGSKKEFREMVEFVREKKIHPVVSKVVTGLDNLEGIESLFDEMKAGRQFGKLVIELAPDNSSSKL